jgi:hypothetical protein
MRAAGTKETGFLESEREWITTSLSERKCKDMARNESWSPTVYVLGSDTMYGLYLS